MYILYPLGSIFFRISLSDRAQSFLRSPRRNAPSNNLDNTARKHCYTHKSTGDYRSYINSWERRSFSRWKWMELPPPLCIEHCGCARTRGAENLNWLFSSRLPLPFNSLPIINFFFLFFPVNFLSLGGYIPRPVIPRLCWCQLLDALVA